MTEHDACDADATIAAWRARGDHRLAPVRFHLIEALVRRASGHQGEARRILDEKVAGLVAAYGEDLERARSATAVAADKVPPQRSALAELVEHIARQAPADANVSPAGDPARPRLAPPELKALKYFRSTWSKLSAHRRLTQSLADVPGNAGPLNSHHLVHRSLALMHELSPEYLNQFMSYVDTLLWFDEMNTAGASSGANAARAEGGKKAGRGKSAG